MDIYSTIQYLSMQADQVEENLLPKKTNRIKEVRIIDTKTVLIKNFPLESQNFYKLYEYAYFGQFKNVKAVQLMGSSDPLTLDTLIEFQCDISAALSLMVS